MKLGFVGNECSLARTLFSLSLCVCVCFGYEISRLVGLLSLDRFFQISVSHSSDMSFVVVVVVDDDDEDEEFVLSGSGFLVS